MRNSTPAPHTFEDYERCNANDVYGYPNVWTLYACVSHLWSCANEHERLPERLAFRVGLSDRLHAMNFHANSIHILLYISYTDTRIQCLDNLIKDFVFV